MRDLIDRLLDARGPSGFETRAAAVWREEADAFADETWGDVHGNSFAAINPGGSPRVMMAGHIDEIGLMVNHIDEQGYLWVRNVGGWDAQVLVGQRVEILSASGLVPGVVGRRAVHLIRGDDSEKAVKLKDLWIDIGAASAEEAREKVSIGDVGVIQSQSLELTEDLLAARSIDDRVGAVVVLEALRRAARKGCSAHAVAAATVQEEIGYMAAGGARTGSYGLDPDVGIVVDVTHATDHPNVDKKEHGDIRLGGGPVLARGAAINPVVFDRLANAAREAGFEPQIQAIPAMTGTDADAIRMARAGVATGLVSIPNRYMHSPNQLVSLRDLDQAAEVIANFLVGLSDGDSFLPA
ncbi:MAG: M20/M25/M40 family metallo-hydrolase [marine benthic group bacterium]|jgi:endoglucanase|nr:M20/M25/M40 family metallo-hydrolase [Candidatus Benthicola marisminoris]